MHMQRVTGYSATSMTIARYTSLLSALQSRIINNQSEGSVHPLFVPFTRAHGFKLVFSTKALCRQLVSDSESASRSKYIRVGYITII